MSHRDLSDLELRALAFVDERELVRDLVDLISVPSVSGSDAECDVQHRLAKQVGELGLDVDLWQLDLPRLTAGPAFPGWEATRTEAWGLVASSGPGEPELVLQGHVDVVPSGDLAQWRHDPFRATVEGRRIHGRGSGEYAEADGALHDLVAAAHADVTRGPRPRERGAPYGSDLRLYSAAGVPTLHYGPGDVRLAHGPEESVVVDELVAVTESLVLALVRACRRPRVENGPMRRTLSVVLGSVLCLALLAPGALLAPADAGGPRTWRVGPDRELRTPSAAAAVALDGDTVLIDAGTYAGDVATWTQDDLTLRGAGGRAHLRADGASAQGKAIWVLAGDRTSVDRLEFSGAAVPDGNGAGIRQEGDDLTVTRSWFHHNENGILTGAAPDSDVVIRRSRFFRNGAGDGYTHNIYVGAVRSLTVTGSWLWGADTGHELKSRAARNTVVGNLVSDRDSTASYSIDLPNGGRSLVAGNTIVQGPHSENSALVSYGAEGFTGSKQLWVVNNTFVNRRSTGTFVSLDAGSRAVLRNNLLVGPGDLTTLSGVPARGNRRVGLRHFADPAHDDFRLRAGSPAIDRGVRVPQRWRPRWEYVHPAGQERRHVAGRVDLGAFERRR